MDEPTGILCRVLRSPGTDCSANGVTARFDSFVLTGDGVRGPFNGAADCPTLKLVRTSSRHGETLKAVVTGAEAKVGGVAMFGGNFVHASDGRFPSLYPIPVHDRFERPTPASAGLNELVNVPVAVVELEARVADDRLLLESLQAAVEGGEDLALEVANEDDFDDATKGRVLELLRFTAYDGNHTRGTDLEALEAWLSHPKVTPAHVLALVSDALVTLARS